MTYCLVENGEITAYNVIKPKVPGVSFGKNPTPADYAQYGWYLVTGAAPTLLPFQFTTMTYEIREATKTVEKVYTVVDMSLDDAKAEKLKDLKTTFQKVSKRPVVNTGFGFTVHGGYSDLTDFEVGRELGFLKIRSVDNQNNDVTAEEFDAVIKAIKINGLGIKQAKWSHEAAINNATTLEDLRLIDTDAGWPA